MKYSNFPIWNTNFPIKKMLKKDCNALKLKNKTVQTINI